MATFAIDDTSAAGVAFSRPVRRVTGMRAAIMTIGVVPLVACQQVPAPDAKPAEQSIAQPTAAIPITLTAADGVAVAGLHYRALRPTAVILLFHQGGVEQGGIRDDRAAPGGGGV